MTNEISAEGVSECGIFDLLGASAPPTANRSSRAQLRSDRVRSHEGEHITLWAIVLLI